MRQDIEIESEFQRIYDATHRRALAYLLARADTPEDAADLCQEVYEELLKVLRRKGRGYVAEPEAFVLNLARTRLSKHYRRRSGKAVELPLEVSGEDGEELERWLDAGVDVEGDAAAHDLMARVEALVRGEDAAARRVFYLHFGLGLTLAECAAEMGVPESTAKSKLYRTLRKIREKIEY